MSNLKEKLRSQHWGKEAMVTKEEAERLVTRLSLIFLRKGIEIKEKAAKKK